VSYLYKIPKEAVQQQKRAIVAATLTLFVCVPLFTIAAGSLFHLDRSTLTTRDIWSITTMLGIPCALLWLNANAMKSFRIQLEDDRVIRIQNHPLGFSPLIISFVRKDIGHIREVRKDGLYIHGRGCNGKYIELHIPRTVENYDDLRSRLAAWHPIHDSWL
jgi:hypothetical protein